jgi:phospholipid/cholesterol/gamma-HCH transport system permease protein
MENAADFDVAARNEGRTAVLTGDWTAVALGDAGARLDALLHAEAGMALDLTKIGRCDTAGALAIVKASEGRTDPSALAAAPRTKRLLDLVSRGLKAEPVPTVQRRQMTDMLERLGRGLIGVGHDFYGTMAFTGHLVVVVLRTIVQPWRIRWAPIFSLAERAGLDAIPIVAVTTFFIGAVVGFIGANELAQFGAQVFAVELIGISIMREFNIIITAVLLAGRSASSFAAEIGSMKMNQEIDAMRVMGVDPFEALVLPRFLALLITIPLLTFVATLAGLAGGILVSWVVLDLSPSFFIQRMLANVSVNHFWVALSKAPVMAIVIAGIGCRQGMEVGGDVESLGRRVTSAVVHAIFSIILIDALFALLYMELKV